MEGLYKKTIQHWKKHKRNIPWDKGNSAWTRWIKNTFYEIGHKKKFEVENSKAKKHGKGEYLVDVCWWIEKKDKYWLELALESEWIDTVAEIEHDFYKLIDIKAKNKIWICSYGDRIYSNRKSKIIEFVKKAKIAFAQEKYLIINIPDSQKKSEQNRLIIDAFWIDYKGNYHKLSPEKIERYRSHKK